jgi:hypothetical protein
MELEQDMQGVEPEPEHTAATSSHHEVALPVAGRSVEQEQGMQGLEIEPEHTAATSSHHEVVLPVTGRSTEQEQGMQGMEIEPEHTATTSSHHEAVLPVDRRSKRSRSKRSPSPGDSADNAIDITSEYQMCVGGKFYEVIDLLDDEVRFC